MYPDSLSGETLACSRPSVAFPSTTWQIVRETPLLPQCHNCKINLILHLKIHYIHFMARGGKTTNKIEDYNKNAARIRKLTNKTNKTLKITITYVVQLLAMCKETIKRKEKATPTDERLLQQKMNSE